jgi:hypothetical protein
MLFSFAVSSHAGTKTHKSSSKTKSTKAVKHKEEKKKQHLAKKSHPKKKEMTTAERKALAKKQVEKARRDVAARKAKEKKLPEKIYPSFSERSDTKLAYKEKREKFDTIHEPNQNYEVPAATTNEENTERDIASVEETTPEKTEWDDFQFIDEKFDNTETMDVSDAGDSDNFDN